MLEMKECCKAPFPEKLFEEVRGKGYCYLCQRQRIKDR